MIMLNMLTCSPLQLTVLVCNQHKQLTDVTAVKDRYKLYIYKNCIPFG